jgi:tetratricopeptide (TPR) repeat protein
MRKIGSIVVVLAMTVGAFGCHQQKEEQTPVTNISPVPSQAEITWLEQAAKDSPKNKEGWIKLGNVMMDSRRYNEAIDAYQKALDLDPKNVPVRVDMGTCYRRIGKSDKAVEEYRKAIRIDPNVSMAHRNLGVVLADDMHDNKRAIPEFQKYLNLVPNAPDEAIIRQTIQMLSTGK